MTSSFSKQLDQLIEARPQKQLFVAGTDTDIGKTIFTWQLAERLRQRGESVVVFKPVESGAPSEKDSDFFARHLGRDSCVCCYSFDRPVSPHFEAERTGRSIDFDTIRDCYSDLRRTHDWVLVEGAGGLYCPLGEGRFMLDLLSHLNLPAALVLRNRVGCLNHTLLSLEALRNRQVALAGLVVNGEENRDNIEALTQMAATPVLAVMPDICIISR